MRAQALSQIYDENIKDTHEMALRSGDSFGREYGGGLGFYGVSLGLQLGHGLQEQLHLQGEQRNFRIPKSEFVLTFGFVCRFSSLPRTAQGISISSSSSSSNVLFWDYFHCFIWPLAETVRCSALASTRTPGASALNTLNVCHSDRDFGAALAFCWLFWLWWLCCFCFSVSLLWYKHQTNKQRQLFKCATRASVLEK